MKKSELLKSVKVIILGLVLSVGVAYVSAATWTPPPATAPGGNVDGPLNVGTSYQKKSGNLDIGNFSASTSGSGLLRTERGFLSGGPTLLKDVVMIGIAPSDIQDQSVSFNSQNQKSKGFFAKLSNFFGFTDDSLKTKTALAAADLTPINCNLPSYCIPPSECTALFGTYDSDLCIYSNGTNTNNAHCCTIQAIPPPVDVTFTASPTSITTGGSTTLSWTSNGTACTASSAPTISSWSGPKPLDGPQTITSLNSTVTFSLNCVNTSAPNITPTQKSVTVTASPLPTNGLCGSSNGGTFSSAPSTSLCSAGNATLVTGSGADTGYWKWQCMGVNGGTNASCSANKTATPPPPPQTPISNILTVWGNSKLNGGLAVTGTITSNSKNVCLQDGTNCPVSGGTGGGDALWKTSTNPIDIEPVLAGAVSIPNGTLKLGTGSYAINTATSILNTLQLNKSSTMTSPNLYGGTTGLILGNDVSGSGSVLSLGSSDTIFSSPSSGSLIFKNGNTEMGRLEKYTSGTGIGLRSADSSAFLKLNGGLGGLMTLKANEIMIIDSDLYTDWTSPPANPSPLGSYSPEPVEYLCIHRYTRSLVVCGKYGM